MKATPQPLIRVAYAEDHHLVRVALSEKLEQTGKVNVTVSVGDGADVFPGKQTSNGELLKAITALHHDEIYNNGHLLFAHHEHQSEFIKYYCLSKKILKKICVAK